MQFVRALAKKNNVKEIMCEHPMLYLCQVQDNKCNKGKK